MSNLNRIVLIGRPTEEPEIRLTVNGVPMARFTLVVDRIPRPETVVKADYIPVVAWREVAEEAKACCQKGVLLMAEGRIVTRSYDSENGQRKWITEVEASLIRPLVSSTDETGVAPESHVIPMMTSASVAPVYNAPMTIESKPQAPIQESDFDFSDTPKGEMTPFELISTQNGEPGFEFDDSESLANPPAFGMEAEDEQIPF